MFSCLISLVKWGVFLAVLVFLIHFWMARKSYVFDAESVAKIAEKYVDMDPKKAYDEIYLEFADAHPGHILPAEDLEWLFMNAGGWMGSVCILHASVTEYLLFFGTAIDTSGHSGRYWANISDTILTGSFRQWQEGGMNSVVYGPGETILHTVGEATAVQWSAGTWMVEYGRGFIPSTLGFALADTFFSTQDFITLFYILRVYSKALLMEMGTFMHEHKDNLFGIGTGE